MNKPAYSILEAGPLDQWSHKEVTLPGLPSIPGKDYLKEQLGLTGCEISINSLLPGEVWPYNHSHKLNEEVYIFLKGNGQMKVDQEVISVTEGTILRVAPHAARTWRNNSTTPLVYLVIQTQENSLTQYTLSDAIPIEGEVDWS